MSTQVSAEFEYGDGIDIAVVGSFQNRYGDERLAVVGDTYEVFKEGDVYDALDWETCHQSWESPIPPLAKRDMPEQFEDADGVYLIDGDDESVEHFEQTVEEAGFEVARDVSGALKGLDEAVQPEEAEWDGDASERVTVQEGSTIEVEYLKAKGDWGEGTERGVVVGVSESSVAFRNEDGKSRWVRFNESCDVALECQSQYPFMGPVEKVRVLSE